MQTMVTDERGDGPRVVGELSCFYRRLDTYLDIYTSQEKYNFEERRELSFFSQPCGLQSGR